MDCIFKPHWKKEVCKLQDSFFQCSQKKLVAGFCPKYMLHLQEGFTPTVICVLYSSEKHNKGVYGGL